ncbi:hypothetical protein HYW42_02600 [Candidatus Daviesbacteria bacterium]|nr:hypothetical protein [Candidatus Daviesbacteria bacterium]
MRIYISTSDRKKVEVALISGKDRIDVLSEENEFGSQVLLPLIEKIMRRNNLGYEALEAVDLDTGFGSFTGLRVGASVANALGFGLKIPVNGKKVETDLKY